MKKKIVISAGGTGGHLFPALALAHALRERAADSELLFLGGGLAANRYFERETFPFKQIACGSFQSRKPWNLIRNGSSLAFGLIQSYALLRRFKPDVVVGFGSYHGFPPLVAAKALSIPMVLYESNAVPGKVVRLMSPHAAVTGLHFDAAASHLKGKTHTVGMPLRRHMEVDRTTSEAARHHYGLDPSKITLLVFGGSQGAQAINHLMIEASSLIAKQMETPFQVLHFTGHQDSVDQGRQAYAISGISSHVAAFETRMGLAWSAADLALCRSGAGTVAEARVFAVPLIMIPYPYATDAHQEHNADVVVALGGGQKLIQSHITSAVLAASIATHLNNHSKCYEMHQALIKARHERHEVALVDLVWQTLNKM